MTAQELREKYIEFFKKKGHQEIPSASLVPENDPTVLFTTAGMHPLIPYLMGEKHPKGKRLVSVQKCARTGDIEDVGDSSHNTFFEMLGNWSLGDYFKKDSIRWSWEFLTDKKWLNISPEKIKVTVFKGDSDSPKDKESIKIWQECFEKSKISFEVYDKKKKNNKSARIFPLPKKDNWWGPAGETGPCGPDTEIFIDLGKPVNFKKCPDHNNCKPGCNCGRYVEIWNNVFMQYNKSKVHKVKSQKSKLEKEYEYVKLEQKNVDTGMGLERTLAILNGFDNVYETDVFAPIVAQIQKISRRHCEEERRSNPENISPITGIASPAARNDSVSHRIIADHIRTSVFMISDGVTPSNLDRGYILRRLLRRAIRHGNLLKMPNGFLLLLAKTVIDIYQKSYPELEKNKNKILEEIKKEEEKFEKVLKEGLKKFNNYVLTRKPRDKYGRIGVAWDQCILYGKDAFYLYQTFGFPKEMMQELCEENNIKFYEEEFDNELKKHQELSRTASAGMFKGGLADTGEQAIKYHTATHLLLESLRRILGNHICQKGSNINADRLRFDFAHSEKLTVEEKQKVEDLVNKQIQKKLPISCEEMNLEKAKQLGAIGVFDSKYGDKVKVYTIGDVKDVFSREICNGPHIKNISELGKFKIKKELSSSAGVRRIKAVLE